MGLERPLRKRAGGTFLGRGRVPALSDASGTDVDESATVGSTENYLDPDLTHTGNISEIPPLRHGYAVTPADGGGLPLSLRDISRTL